MSKMKDQVCYDAPTDHDPLCNYKPCDCPNKSTLCRCHDCQCELITTARDTVSQLQGGQR